MQESRKSQLPPGHAPICWDDVMPHRQTNELLRIFFPRPRELKQEHESAVMQFAKTSTRFQ